jgi:hypothetical protein
MGYLVSFMAIYYILWPFESSAYHLKFIETMIDFGKIRSILSRIRYVRLLKFDFYWGEYEFNFILQ